MQDRGAGWERKDKDHEEARIAFLFSSNGNHIPISRLHREGRKMINRTRVCVYNVIPSAVSNLKVCARERARVSRKRAVEKVQSYEKRS